MLRILLLALLTFLISTSVYADQWYQCENQVDASLCNGPICLSPEDNGNRLCQQMCGSSAEIVGGPNGVCTKPKPRPHASVEWCSPLPPPNGVPSPGFSPPAGIQLIRKSFTGETETICADMNDVASSYRTWCFVEDDQGRQDQCRGFGTSSCSTQSWIGRGGISTMPACMQVWDQQGFRRTFSLYVAKITPALRRSIRRDIRRRH
jgi:hypothetical protein